jgi:hypothetical protein
MPPSPSFRDASHLLLALAISTATLACRGGDESDRVETAANVQALTSELPPPPGNKPTGPVEPLSPPAAPSRPIHLRPLLGRPALPAQTPNRLLYRQPVLSAGPTPTEPKHLDSAPPKRLGALPHSPAPISGAEYRRRTEAYLAKWEAERSKHADLPPREQQALQAVLKRSIVGE